MNYVLWGLAPNETRSYMEDFIGDYNDKSEYQKAARERIAQGWKNLRVTTYSPNQPFAEPDFIGTLTA